MTKKQKPCVLVHGAWHGAWCWDEFKPYLTERGLTPIAPDLPGHGGRPLPLAEVSLAGYADAIAEILDGLAEPAILVGHSMGGIVISEAAERRPDKVRHLVYLSAFLLPDGVAMAARMKEDTGSLAARFVRRTEDGRGLLMGEEGLRTAIYEGVAAPVVDRAVKLSQPQAIAPFMTPLHLTAERFGRAPRAFVECTEDKAITLDMQRRMQRDLPCDPVLTLACGHCPHDIAPEALADFLAKL